MGKTFCSQVPSVKPIKPGCFVIYRLTDGEVIHQRYFDQTPLNMSLVGDHLFLIMGDPITFKYEESRQEYKNLTLTAINIKPFL